MEEDLIAPCGMYCAICSGYLAYLNQIPRKRGKISHCKGCRARDKKCAWLKGDCELLAKGKVRYCFECPDFPCGHLQHIDARYRRNFGMSMIENLETIRDRGVKAFLREQKARFTCSRCQGLISVHSGKCYVCDDIISWKE
ncbi:MAG: DUF3795 domain-containing protein [Thermoleophilia bacterium]